MKDETTTDTRIWRLTKLRSCSIRCCLSWRDAANLKHIRQCLKPRHVSYRQDLLKAILILFGGKNSVRISSQVAWQLCYCILLFDKPPFLKLWTLDSRSKRRHNRMFKELVYFTREYLSWETLLLFFVRFCYENFVSFFFISSKYSFVRENELTPENPA